MKQALFITVSILFLVTMIANSQTRLSRREYIDLYKQIAIREMYRSGIPASITMAQGCLESDNGNSVLSRRSNNHFGIKCKTGWDGPRVYHNDDTLNECFRQYKTVEESFIDHSNFLMSNPRYAPLFKLGHTDYKAWAHGLKNTGYATDPKYAERLITIIEEERLHALDKVRPQDLPEQEPENEEENLTAGTSKRIRQALNKITLNPYDQREVFEKNGLKAITVKAGDTYESIARELGMKPWELYVYNDVPRSEEQPAPNTVLYVQRKRYNAPKGNDFYTVKAQEDMHDVAQKFGIRENSLYRKNRMEKGTEPKTGQKLYLRKRKPKNNNK